MKGSYGLMIYLLIGGLSLMKCTSDNNTSKAIVPNVLIFTKTRAFRHECIEPGVKAMQSYFAKAGITSVQSEDSLMMTDEKLKTFDAIMFFQTTGNILDSTEQEALMKFVHSGKGFIGVHAAADAEYDWPWFGELIGARFADHPDIQSGALIRIDSAKMATAHLPMRWTRTDEWYNFKLISPTIHIELMADEAMLRVKLLAAREFGGRHRDHPRHQTKHHPTHIFHESRPGFP